MIPKLNEERDFPCFTINMLVFCMLFNRVWLLAHNNNSKQIAT